MYLKVLIQFAPRKEQFFQLDIKVNFQYDFLLKAGEIQRKMGIFYTEKSGNFRRLELSHKRNVSYLEKLPITY